MENDNLEVGGIDMSQENVQRFVRRAREYNHTNPFSPCISMVPSVLRNLSPDSFNPRMVSIGPLHRGDKNVQAFEWRKLSYMINLIGPIESQQEQILKLCMNKAHTLMNEIKTSYGTNWANFSDDAQIAKMMVMDACFMLGFLMQVYISEKNIHKSYPGTVLELSTLMHDLMLLENQIPLFFLEEIFQCTISRLFDDVYLLELVRPLILSHNIFTRNIKWDYVNYMSDSKHILSLLHKCYEPRRYTPPTNNEKDITHTRIQSVVDLDRAGVKFKPNKDQTWVMVEWFPYFFGFWRKPTLTMPVLIVDDSTEFILRNLIAYEQSSLRTQSSVSENCSFHPSYVSEYAFTINMLVNTKDDVAKLVNSRVLINIMGSNEEAVSMINSICKNVKCGDSFFVAEWANLNSYCNSYWPKNIARLKRTYFNSPWSVIALFGGIIIFVLQVVQTIYTIKSV